MTIVHRDFGNLPEREVSFTWAGEQFHCRASVGVSLAEWFGTQLEEDPTDPSKVGVPLAAAVEYLHRVLLESEVERFDKTLEQMPVETLHEIRNYLAGVYAGVDPTSEEPLSPPGSSPSVASSPVASG